MALIAGSIREFGFTNPILVDGENGIIAGHGRLLAARKLGLDQVPVIELAHLSAAQKQALLLADNKLAERAGWDQDLLALEVGDLSELGVDLSSLGFEAGEIDALLHGGARRSARGGDAGAARPSRCPDRAISGCSARTGCSAATPRTRPTSRGCSAASRRI